MQTIHTRWVCVLAALLGFMLLTTGCAAIQSSAVESLIEKQGQKIETAKKNAGQFKKQNQSRRSAYMKSLADLNTALEQVQTFESLVALIFSSNQNLEGKRGIDAQAVTYLAGTLYWAKQAGLEQEVRDQFEADFAGLDRLAASIESSWVTLDTLNQNLEAYSKKSGFVRNVDPAFFAALFRQTKTDVEGIGTLLKKSQEVNDALKKAARFKPLSSGTSAQAHQQFVSELIDLLERVKADAREQGSSSEGQGENNNGGER